LLAQPDNYGSIAYEYEKNSSNSHFESFIARAELVEARSPFDKLRANGELKDCKAILRTAGRIPIP
jgi:hypothetical protein